MNDLQFREILDELNNSNNDLWRNSDPIWRYRQYHFLISINWSLLNFTPLSRNLWHKGAHLYVEHGSSNYVRAFKSVFWQFVRTGLPTGTCLSGLGFLEQSGC